MNNEGLQRSVAIEQSQAIAFDRVISPLRRDAFLCEFWGKSFLRLVGYKGKFAALLSWEELNAILKQHRLPPSQLKLFRDGKRIDSNHYMAANKGKPRLNPAALINCLSD